MEKKNYSNTTMRKMYDVDYSNSVLGDYNQSLSGFYEQNFFEEAEIKKMTALEEKEYLEKLIQSYEVKDETGVTLRTVLAILTEYNRERGEVEADDYLTQIANVSINVDAFHVFASSMTSFVLKRVSLNDIENQLGQEIHFDFTKKFLGISSSSLTATYYGDDLGVYPISLQDDFHGTTMVTREQNKTFYILKQFYENNESIFRKLLSQSKKQRIFQDAIQAIKKEDERVLPFSTVLGLEEQEDIEYKCYFDILKSQVSIKYAPKMKNKSSYYGVKGAQDSILNSDYLFGGWTDFKDLILETFEVDYQKLAQPLSQIVEWYLEHPTPMIESIFHQEKIKKK